MALLSIVGSGRGWGGWHELNLMVNRCEILIWWIHIFTQLISINVIECRGASGTELKVSSNRTWTEVDLEQSERGFKWASVQFRILNPTELLPNSTLIQVSSYPTEPPIQLSYCPIEPRFSSNPYMNQETSASQGFSRCSQNVSEQPLGICLKWKFYQVLGIERIKCEQCINYSKMYITRHKWRLKYHRCKNIHWKAFVQTEKPLFE